MTRTGESTPPHDDVARAFVTWLETRGATLTFRHDTDWYLDLDGVADMTQGEAAAIAAAAFAIREEIRAVLVRRRAAQAAETVH